MYMRETTNCRCRWPGHHDNRIKRVNQALQRSGHFKCTYMYFPTLHSVVCLLNKPLLCLNQGHNSNFQCKLITDFFCSLFVLCAHRSSGHPDMNYFVMDVLPIPARNIEGHPNFHSIGDPPSSSRIAEQNPVSVLSLLEFALDRTA